MPAIILDRDGVINYDSDQYIKSPVEWLPIPESLKAIALLNSAGYQVFIATNQSGVARGLYDLATLQRIHDKLQTELAQHGGRVEEIFYCPHHPDDNCYCRKPKPGLIEQIKLKYDINCHDTFFIGDSHVDIAAARAGGCTPLLVLTGNGELTLNQHKDIADKVLHFPNLYTAVKYILTSSSELK